MSSPTNTAPGTPSGDDFGTNSWLVEEMYERFRDNPAAVSEQWREFFSDYKPGDTPGGSTRSATSSNGNGVAATSSAKQNGAKPSSDDTFPMRRPAGIVPTQEAPAPAPAVLTPPSEPEPIRGVAAAIATNMERSLGVPTATSVRQIPAKLLEVNRRVINGYRSRTGQSKVSFTHLIGYAVVRALVDAVPNMKNVYVVDGDGKPQLQRHTNVNLGLAVDVDKEIGRAHV